MGAAASERMRGRYGDVSERCHRDLIRLMREISEEERIQNIYVLSSFLRPSLLGLILASAANVLYASTESPVSPTLKSESAPELVAWTEKCAQLNRSNQRAELQVAGRFPSWLKSKAGKAGKFEIRCRF